METSKYDTSTIRYEMKNSKKGNSGTVYKSVYHMCIIHVQLICDR
jgi:hypothetical protein